MSGTRPSNRVPRACAARSCSISEISRACSLECVPKGPRAHGQAAHGAAREEWSGRSGPATTEPACLRQGYGGRRSSAKAECGAEPHVTWRAIDHAGPRWGAPLAAVLAAAAMTACNGTGWRTFSVDEASDRLDSRRAPGRPDHLPAARAAVPRPDRGLRQAGAGHQRDHRRQPGGARARRRARRGVRDGRVRRPASLHPGDREGQLRHEGPADDGGIAVARRLHAGQGRVPREAAARGGRDRAGQVEHGRVRLQPVRDGELDPAGLHAQPVLALPGHRRVERRHRRRHRRQLRRHRPRLGHRELHPRPLVAPGAGGHPVHDGPDEPRRHRPAEPGRGRGRPDDAHRGRRGRRAAGGRGLRPRRPGHRGEPGAHAPALRGRARPRRA